MRVSLTEASKLVMSYVAAVCGKGEQVNSVKEQLLQSNPVLEGENSSLCPLTPRQLPQSHPALGLLPQSSNTTALVQPEKPEMGTMTEDLPPFPSLRPAPPLSLLTPLPLSLQLLAMPRPFATTTPLDL